MTDMKAGVWLIGLVIYFGILVLVTYGATTIDISSYNSTIGDTDLNFITADNICSPPRAYIDINGEIKMYTQSTDDNLICREMGFSGNEDSCNEIEGCTWTEANSSTIFWGLITVGNNIAYCGGYVNGTYYGMDVTSNGKHVALHETSKTRLWGLVNDRSNSACTDEAVLFNYTLCNMFSCDWIPYDYTEDFKAPNIMSTFGNLFSWRYGWGVSGSALKFLLNLFFVIIPQIGIVISAYFLLR